VTTPGSRSATPHRSQLCVRGFRTPFRCKSVVFRGANLVCTPSGPFGLLWSAASRPYGFGISESGFVLYHFTVKDPKMVDSCGLQ
jgi:hypothetical protein